MQVGYDEDYMLSLNETNCPSYKATASSTRAEADATDAKILKEKYAKYYDLVEAKKSNLWQFCGYLEWADTSGVELKD